MSGTTDTTGMRQKGKPGASAAGADLAPPSEARLGLGVLLVYAFVALYLVPIFPHDASANEETRWATTASVVEHRSFEISWAERLFGPIVDTAKFGGRVYSNKAPAPALLAVPGYVATRPFVGGPETGSVRVSWTVMRWLIATLPLLLLSVFAWRRGARPAALFGLLFATPLFIYGLLLFSHVLVGAAVFGAYWLLFRGAGSTLVWAETEDGTGTGRALLAGVLAGLAVSSEFVALVPVAVFGLGVLLQGQRPMQDRIRAALAFAAGGLPFAIGIAIYNNALFGSPFSLSYAHEGFAQWAEVAKQGLFGISWPTAQNLWLLLISPSRGLFVISPLLLVGGVLLLGSAGIFRSPAARIAPGLYASRVRLAAVALSILVMSGHGAAHGGWAAGPRYLVFVIPLLMEPILQSRALFTNRSERREGEAPLARRPGRSGRSRLLAWDPGQFLTGVALGAATALSVLPILTFPFAPPEVAFPHATFWRPLLIGEGWAVPTLGALVGLGSGPIALIPAVLAIAAALALSLRGCARGLVAGTVIGLLGSLAYCFLPGLEDADGVLRRASIEERFFRPTGRLEAIAPKITDARQARFLETMRWQAAESAAQAPSGWPYTATPIAKEGPYGIQKRALELQEKHDLEGAASALREGREAFPFARCAFTDNLAVVLYQSGKKDQALSELEAVRPVAEQAWSAGCLNALFHLGMLRQETGDAAGAGSALRAYVQRAGPLTDQTTVGQRGVAARTLGQPR